MYKIEHQESPMELKLNSSISVGRVIAGLIFMGIGLLMLATASGIIDVPNSPPTVMLVIGTIFLVLSLVFWLAKKGLVLDKGRGEILKWYGLLIPMKTSTLRTDEFDKVKIIKEEKRTKNSKVIFYPVKLVKKDAEDSFTVDTFMSYHQGRVFAEKIALFFELPLHDESTGRLQIRQPADLNKSIKQLAKEKGEKVELPAMPPNMTASVKQDGEGIIIEIPVTRTILAPFFPAVASTVGVAIFLIFFAKILFSASANKPYIFLAILVGVILYAVIAWKLADIKSKKGWVVKASPILLNITEVKWGSKKVFEIPAEELEEFRLIEASLPEGVSVSDDGMVEIDPTYASEEELRNPSQLMKRNEFLDSPKFQKLAKWLFQLLPKPYIVAISDKSYVEWGRGLTESELKYLYALIKKTMIE